jgi:hypothetical protein
MVLLAFTEGLLSAHHLAFFFLYTKVFSLDLLTYSIFETILSILHCLNPIYGYISDTYSLFGTKKKSYMIIVGIISTIGYAYCGLCDVMHLSIGLVFLANFIIDMTNSFKTVLVDSLCVLLHNIHKFGITHENDQNSRSSVSLLYSSRLCGRIITMIIFGLSYSYFGVRCKLISFLFFVRSNFCRGHCRSFSHRANNFTYS